MNEKPRCPRCDSDRVVQEHVKVGADEFGGPTIVGTIFGCRDCGYPDSSSSYESSAG